MRVVHRNRYRPRRLDICQFAATKIKRSGDAGKIYRGDGRAIFVRTTENTARFSSWLPTLVKTNRQYPTTYWRRGFKETVMRSICKSNLLKIVLIALMFVSVDVCLAQ